ncbi:Valine--tRNA ligase [Slackia heliotrinireducens]|uniref:Valine--tRNA ligase n=1 Tax=Slackia heliotrinireducens (strain ATCC 29202 / DSM 20476 / NCTC 11029 / RHS 1) TaxID=471855 RepID=C7N5M2_SLAHD|nr:valine--tRNA ligase [Slackia heliotrinireducens]ACV22207.1 valyl-tRNA synthetase [Slackia heliotrinireducens DSM 20476]VEH00318.1 Valine--tRNA ligase [Slackia heliotrinireducens]
MEEMPKNYDAAQVEERMLQKWLDGGFYARSKGSEDRTVVIPPPNVTGMLHMGHALDDTIQDTFIRYCRMRGYSTRWILGTDHAGIATQTKVDKKLKAEGISRLEIGREKFLEACQDWRVQYGGIIVEQIKRMGCSVDFDDEKFTMSPEYAKAVRKVFVDWYHDDLIYRGKRIVNWCPNCTTAISDDEAEYQDEHGHLWHLRYPLTEPVDGIEHITVATTRPETMLGDTGIAVSPDDPDKAKFIGKTVMLPIVNREIPIFSDWHVDAGFGTGFVKVTPAHDPNDFAMGQAHDLPQINVFDEHAVVVEGYGEFTGMDRDECRVAIVKWFEDHGLLDHVDDHDHSVMHCYRCDSTLEPWLSEQWFVGVDKLKGPALDVVNNGQVKFHPDRWTQTYTTWMENLKDWCISRQLWWGHRIPVFYCDECGWEDALMEDVDTCPKCGGHVHQDEDVLDTWFSSQLWTFATQGWPDNLDELEGHHPTKVLVTARDIIALWVARMVMSSLYFTGQIPFEDVFIYATILAKDGSRMSKSKGNGVDPMDLINMYGADAMRYNLLTLVTGSQDVKFDADIDPKTHELLGSPRTDAARGFVTKIWNASRFVMMNLDGYTPGEPVAATAADAWIFSRLAKLTKSITDGIEAYEFGDVSRELYDFFWNEFCDWYIEMTKDRLRGEGEERAVAQRNLVYVLDTALRLLHPVMPFVTEAIWEHLPVAEGQPALMVAQWPDPVDYEKWVDDNSEVAVAMACGVVGAIRSTRAQYRLSPKADVPVVVKVPAASEAALAAQAGLITSLARVSNLTVAANAERPAESAAVIAEGCEVYCVLSGLVDFAAERQRLEAEQKKLSGEYAKLEKKLSNEGFVQKAKPEAVEKAKAQFAEVGDKLALIAAQLSELA